MFSRLNERHVIKTFNAIRPIILLCPLEVGLLKLLPPLISDPNLAPIDGGWSQWGPWGPCSGEGVQYGPSCGPGAGWKERRRTCNSPAPKHGGSDCEGDKLERQACDLKPCEIRKATAWTPWVIIQGVYSKR